MVTLEILLTPTIKMTYASKVYVGVNVPTSRSKPVGSSQGTYKKLSVKWIWLERMAGTTTDESNRGKQRKGKQVKVAETIKKEEDSPIDEFQNTKEEESRSRLDSSMNMDSLDSEATHSDNDEVSKVEKPNDDDDDDEDNDLES
ncbi:hypothetical protein Tco_0603476 [Tanacetum coccineum]